MEERATRVFFSLLKPIRRKAPLDEKCHKIKCYKIKFHEIFPPTMNLREATCHEMNLCVLNCQEMNCYELNCH